MGNVLFSGDRIGSLSAMDMEIQPVLTYEFKIFGHAVVSVIFSH